MSVLFQGNYLNQEVARVHNITCTQAQYPQRRSHSATDQLQRVLLVKAYNPQVALHYLSFIIHKHFSILSSSTRCTDNSGPLDWTTSTRLSMIFDFRTIDVSEALSAGFR